MKQLFKSIWAVAAAATLLTGCSKDAAETPAPAAGDFTFNLVAGADTRTEIYDPGEGRGVNIRWTTGDVAEVFVDAYYTKAEAVITDDVATFTGKFKSGLTAGLYKVQGFYPADAYVKTVKDATGKSIAALGLKLPAAQEATTATFDKNADILVAKNMDVEITDADIAAKQKTVDNFTFGRTTAITRIGFKVTNAELTASEETVKSIALTVENENGSKSLAGTFAFDPAAFEYIASTTDPTPVADRNNLFYENGTNKVTVTLTDTPALKDGFNAWISTAPITLTAGDKLTFTVTTSANTVITKTAAVGKEVAFMTTRLNTMNVTLNDDVTITKPAVADGVATLTAEDIAQMTGTVGYGNEKTVTNSFGTWKTDGMQDANRSHIQLKNSGDSYLQIPVLPGYIQSITAEVTNAATTPDNYKGTLFFNNSATDKKTQIAYAQNTAEGVRSVTITIDKSTYSSGYIRTTDGAVRIYSLTVAYISNNDPQLIAQDITAPAVAGTYEAAYSLLNSTETVAVSEFAGCVTEAIAENGTILYSVADNYTAETKEGTITLTAGSLTKTIKVTQQASTLEVSTDAIMIADGAQTATFTVTSADFDWYITVPEGLGLTVTPELEAASDKAVTVTVTYDGTATGEIGQLTVWRTDNDPQQKTVTVNKQASVVQGDKEVTFNFSQMSYANQTDLTKETIEKLPISIVFDKGTNSNTPKYYDSGFAVRAYGGNTFTVSGANATITKIEITFGKSDGTNEISSDPEGYAESSTGTWIGSASSVTFTIVGTSGNRRIQSIKVTYDGAAADERVKLATPAVTAAQDGTSVTLTWEAVPNATGYEYTVGSVNDLTFETSVTVPMAEGTYDWSVTAVADDETKYLPSDPATGSITVTTGEVNVQKWTSISPLKKTMLTENSNLSPTNAPEMLWNGTSTGTLNNDDPTRGIAIATGSITLTTTAFNGEVKDVTLYMAKSNKGIQPETVTVKVGDVVLTAPTINLTSTVTGYTFTAAEPIDATGKTVEIYYKSSKSTNYLQKIAINEN